MQNSGFSAGARTVILAALCAALGGCAGRGTPSPLPVAAAPAVTAPMPAAGPVVARLTDGRQGFVISETVPTDGETRAAFERAVVLMREGEFAAAASWLQTVIERAPGFTAPYINLAIACRRLDRVQEAEQHLKSVLTLLPGHPVASNEYGLLLRQGGRFAEARTIYEGVLAAFPDYLPARRNLGILCDIYLNDPACALEQYQAYSLTVPEDEKVKLWIAEVRTRSKL